MTKLNEITGMLVGLAVGDAVGTTVEFKERGSFAPVTDMVGGGPFNLNKGQWTDDTSMALCLAASLIEKNGFDARDQIEKYLKWRHAGYMSSNGTCFDIGITVQDALNRYLATGNPYAGSQNPNTAGNGSIMRLAPVVIAYHRDRDRLLHFAGESSKTTHGCEEAVESCRLFSQILMLALNSNDKNYVLTGHQYNSSSSKVNAISVATYMKKTYAELSGRGYVIDSLASALWCFNTSRDFREAILLATNIGGDADTIAAICGQIAGAYYGLEGIPEDWVNSISMISEIVSMAHKLYEMSQ